MCCNTVASQNRYYTFRSENRRLPSNCIPTGLLKLVLTLLFCFEVMFSRSPPLFPRKSVLLSGRGVELYRLRKLPILLEPRADERTGKKTEIPVACPVAVAYAFRSRLGPCDVSGLTLVVSVTAAEAAAANTLYTRYALHASARPNTRRHERCRKTFTRVGTR